MQKTIVAIGGGEIKNKTTIEVDRVIASLAKERAKDRRAVSLFLGTASHDSMPYFNSFRKTYTSIFDIKAEVGLLVYGEMDDEKIKSKFELADMIYVGGGDTRFMLEEWKKHRTDRLLREAYERGVIICGLSAGAVCWFQTAYTDYEITRGVSSQYTTIEGLGWLNGVMCPHYDERAEFDEVAPKYQLCYAANNDSAIIFRDGSVSQTIGDCYRFENGRREKL